MLADLQNVWRACLRPPLHQQQPLQHTQPRPWPQDIVLAAAPLHVGRALHHKRLLLLALWRNIKKLPCKVQALLELLIIIVAALEEATKAMVAAAGRHSCIRIASALVNSGRPVSRLADLLFFAGLGGHRDWHTQHPTVCKHGVCTVHSAPNGKVCAARSTRKSVVDFNMGFRSSDAHFDGMKKLICHGGSWKHQASSLSAPSMAGTMRNPPESQDILLD